MRQKLFRIVQYIVLVAAWGYLIYKLASFQDYDFLWDSVRSCGWKEWICLSGALMLVFPNILLEAWKWQTLVEDIELISLRSAWWQVCYGQLTAFVTPFRTGDYPGRVMLMEHRDRWPRLIAQGYLGSIILTAVIAGMGLASRLGVIWAIVFSVVVLLTYKIYPPIAQSMLRYLVWILQLALVLRWAGIVLSPLTAFTLLTTYYLLVTFTPSMPAADAAVRGSWMLVVMEPYGVNVASSAVIAMGMWALNTLIPMFFGIIAQKNLHISK